MMANGALDVKPLIASVLQLKRQSRPMSWWVVPGRLWGSCCSTPAVTEAELFASR